MARGKFGARRCAREALRGLKSCCAAICAWTHALGGAQVGQAVGSPEIPTVVPRMCAEKGYGSSHFSCALHCIVRELVHTSFDKIGHLVLVVCLFLLALCFHNHAVCYCITILIRSWNGLSTIVVISLVFWFEHVLLCSFWLEHLCLHNYVGWCGAIPDSASSASACAGRIRTSFCVGTSFIFLLIAEFLVLASSERSWKRGIRIAATLHSPTCLSRKATKPCTWC